MSPRRHTEYERLFLTASRLKGKERERFLDDACRDQPEVRQAVETLLANVDESAEAGKRPPVFRHETQGIKREVHRRSFELIERWANFMQSPAGPLLMLVFLIVTGFWGSKAVEEGIEQLVSESLVTYLENNEVDLDLMVEAKRAALEYFLSEPELKEEAMALLDELAEREMDSRALRESEKLARIRAILDPIENGLDIHGFSIIERSGRIVAADLDADIGQRVSVEGMSILAPVFEGELYRQPPIAEHRLIEGGDPNVILPVTFGAGPLVRRDGSVLAVLALSYESQLFFSRLFRAIEGEEDWDGFAFDETGTLISETIHLPKLKALGMVPDDPAAGAALRVQLRDPGGDLTTGYRNATPPAAWPQTRMAASALAGESGIDLEGYRNFLGMEVYGAWRWLPQYKIGLAVEFRSSKAFALIRPIKIAFWSMFVLIVLSALSMGGLSYAMKVMRTRMEAGQLGQYTLLEKVGEGGMGQVYKARHTLLRRDTAVKILSTDTIDAENIARFEREVQITSQLAHPNTIEVYDYGHDERTGVFYYAMEYIDGLTLADLLAEDGPQPVARTVHILKQVCGSLAEAHGVGLIHRDIKPLNIMLCERGGMSDVVKVLDFGLVADVEPESGVHLTSEGVIKGTPLYIAPERVLNPAAVDVRSDIYSVGTVAYNLLTGKEIFEGKTSGELVDQVLHKDPVPPSDHLGLPVDEDVERLVMACLEKDPTKRPPSMAVILEELESCDFAQAWTQDKARAWWGVFRARHGGPEKAEGGMSRDSDTADYQRPD